MARVCVRKKKSRRSPIQPDHGTIEVEQRYGFKVEQRYGFVICHDVQVGQRREGMGGRYVKEYFGSWKTKEEAQGELDKILRDEYGSDHDRRWHKVAGLPIVPAGCHVVEMYKTVGTNRYQCPEFLVSLPEESVYEGCL